MLDELQDARRGVATLGVVEYEVNPVSVRPGQRSCVRRQVRLAVRWVLCWCTDWTFPDEVGCREYVRTF